MLRVQFSYRGSYMGVGPCLFQALLGAQKESGLVS